MSLIFKYVKCLLHGHLMSKSKTIKIIDFFFSRSGAKNDTKQKVKHKLPVIKATGKALDEVHCPLSTSRSITSAYSALLQLRRFMNL